MRTRPALLALAASVVMAAVVTVGGASVDEQVTTGPPPTGEDPVTIETTLAVWSTVPTSPPRVTDPETIRAALPVATTAPPPPPTTIPTVLIPPVVLTQPPPPTTVATPPAPPPPAPRSGIEGIIYAAAAEFGVDGSWMVCVAIHESGLSPTAVNRDSGALGLFQHLPQYWGGRAAALGYGYDAWSDPVANARVSAKLLAESGPSHWLGAC